MNVYSLGQSKNFYSRIKWGIKTKMNHLNIVLIPQKYNKFKET